MQTKVMRRVVETQMVSVRKRNIQGRYNSVRHLQRRYLELPPLRVVSIVDSIVTSSVPKNRKKQGGGGGGWKKRDTVLLVLA